MENDEWNFYTTINFGNLNLMQFNIDTRDFHCLAKNNCTKIKDKNIKVKVLRKYGNQFFYTTEEVLDILDRLYDESGANVKWRYLSLDGEGASLSSRWELKYIRIIRTEYGLIICNDNYYALKKSVLDCKVNQELLNAH